MPVAHAASDISNIHPENDYPKLLFPEGNKAKPLLHTQHATDVVQLNSTRIFISLLVIVIIT